MPFARIRRLSGGQRPLSNASTQKAASIEIDARHT